RTVTFNAENAVIELERLTRTAEEPGGDRKSIIGDLTTAVLSKVEQLPAERWPELVATINRLAAGGHLQVTSFDSEEQEAIELLGADGRLEPGAGDYLMINEASVLGTKLSLVMERSADHEIELGD